MPTAHLETRFTLLQCVRSTLSYPRRFHQTPTVIELERVQSVFGKCVQSVFGNYEQFGAFAVSSNGLLHEALRCSMLKPWLFSSPSLNVSEGRLGSFWMDKFRTT
jgi:hypothetical protein